LDNILRVENFGVLTALKNCQENEIAYCKLEDKYFIYHDNRWLIYDSKSIKVDNKGLSLNLLDLNVQAISQLPDMNTGQKKELYYAISDWQKKNRQNFYLLYGKTISYFTLFKKDQKEDDSNLASTILSCLEDFKAVKTYEVNDDSIDIWIKDNNDEIVFLKLFGYDRGLVTYNE
jgi:hypothetical protein